MNIAIFHDGGSKFWMPLRDYWENLGHEVRSHANYSVWRNWEPDLILFEFCNNNVVGYTNKWVDIYGKAPKVVVRCHGVGVRLNVYKNVNFDYVDDVIFVSDWLKRQTDHWNLNHFNTVPKHVVYNGVNLNKFTLKRDFELTYKIGYAGNNNLAKGVDLLPEILEKFQKEVDPRYKLITAFPKENKDRNMNEWYEQIDYLVHPSKYETFGFVVAEALAKGIRPLIGRWDGAEETWGDQFFLDDFNLERTPYRFRKIVEQKYDEKRMVQEVSQICNVV
jgi:glycosyltransferase involved in cell wall biosynthesis